MENVVYTSPFFNTSSVIPAVALKTYQKRDAALIKMRALGGISAGATPEMIKLRARMLAAKRKIEREGWYSQAYHVSNGTWTVVTHHYDPIVGKQLI